MLLLVADSAEQSWFSWVGVLDIAAFVVICGLFQIALAPWLVKQELKIL